MMPHIHLFKFRLFRFLLISLVGIGICGAAPPSVVNSSFAVQNTEVPRFDPEDCSEVVPDQNWNNVDQDRFRCGYFVTWQNYDTQTGTIRLAVMETYPAQEPRPEPVIWLAGGPGGDGFPLDPAEAIKRTDGYGRGWIQFSQRGSYLSQSARSRSALYCPQIRYAVIKNWETPVGEKPLGWEQWNSAISKALVECYGTLGQTNLYDHLPNINSKFNALDVIYLIRELGYGFGKVNLYGGSYGTLLAQHVLALSPGDVRSVVLVGVAPLGVDWNAEYPRNLSESLQRIFDACNTSTECDDTYPNLRETFFELLEQLETEPLCMPVEDGGTSISNVCLDDYGYLLALGNLVSGTENLPKIPRIIYGSWNRDLEHITELGANYYSFERNAEWPWGMYYSIYCSEFPRFDPDSIDMRQIEQQFHTLYTASKQLINKVCPLYDQYGNAYGNTSIANNKIPILIFNGKFDPLTPMKYGNQVSALSAGDVFQFTSETSAHASADSDCAGEIMWYFFNDPKTAPDKNSCWKKEPKDIEFELVTTEGSETPEGGGTSWWEEFLQGISETVSSWSQGLQTWWQQLQEKTEEEINQWWQEQQERIKNAINQWWQDFQKRLAERFWEEYLKLLRQCSGSALLPAVALASVWISRRKKRKVQK